MSPLELLAPDTIEAVPFSVRLAERRLTGRIAAGQSDRRAHLRRNMTELEWLRSVKLLGGSGYDVRLVDLSEGGALLEVDAPLRPGVLLTLELSGPGVEAAVPLEVLRCHLSTLRDGTAIYRGACAFAHLIELPGAPGVPTRTVPPIPAFVGIDAAIKVLLDRYTVAQSDATKVAFARAEMVQVLGALRTRASRGGRDPLNRYASDLLASILPALRGGASRNVVAAALDARLRAMPERWRVQLQPTIAGLASLIDRFAIVPAPPVLPVTSIPVVTAPETTAVDEPLLVTEATAAANPSQTTFQKIVVRYADGKILKGHVQDFHPSKPQFSLWPSINATPKERVVVPVARLKAVFFVRDFNGNAGYRSQAMPTARGQGRRVEVSFADGESITGTTLNYRPDGQGFFVSPADPADNNTRIFVVAAALRRVRFL